MLGKLLVRKRDSLVFGDFCLTSEDKWYAQFKIRIKSINFIHR